MKMKWISIKDRKPPCDSNNELPFLPAYHSLYGWGVAWFHEVEDYVKEELELDFQSKYICSCHFIKNKVDGNWCIDDEDHIDILEISDKIFTNLGTVTHWMEIPENPINLDL